MGRAKLNMELIPKKKSRHITYKKRKDGLTKKMHEFTTLCDVKACMVIYGPKQEETGLSEPEIWPQNTEEVRQIIDIYRSKKKDSNNKNFSLSDFFDDRQRRVEDELSKLKKKNRELKYPTRPECMSFMSEVRLREFAAALVDRVGIVRLRIEFLRSSREGSSLDMNFKYPPGLRGIESGMINNNNNQLGMHLPAIHHHHVDHHQNSMMMLLMKDHRSVQFGPGPASGGGSNIQCASYERQVFYEAAAAGGRGVVDPATMICSPVQLARCYSPSLPQVPYMQMMPPPPTVAYMQMPPLPEIQFPAKAESGSGLDGGGDEQQEDTVTRQYGMMMNHKSSSSYE